MARVNLALATILAQLTFGPVGVSHVEPISITANPVSCGLSALCPIGTATFVRPFPDTNYRCAFSSVATSAVTVIAPAAGTKTVSSVVITGDALLAIVSQGVTIEGICSE